MYVASRRVRVHKNANNPKSVAFVNLLKHHFNELRAGIGLMSITMIRRIPQVNRQAQRKYLDERERAR